MFKKLGTGSSLLLQLVLKAPEAFTLKSRKRGVSPCPAAARF